VEHVGARQRAERLLNWPARLQQLQAHGALVALLPLLLAGFLAHLNLCFFGYFDFIFHSGPVDFVMDRYRQRLRA
jgi:hypothetical protein